MTAPSQASRVAIVQFPSAKVANSALKKLDRHIIKGCTAQVRRRDRVVPWRKARTTCRLIVRNLSFTVR